MSECDPHGNKCNLHGVEICFLDLSFSHHPEADLEKILNAIYQKNPAIDLHVAAQEIRDRFTTWQRNRRRTPTPR